MTTTPTSTTPVVSIRKLSGTYGGWATALLGTAIAVYATRDDARIAAASLKVRTSGLTEAEIRTQWKIAKD